MKIYVASKLERREDVKKLVTWLKGQGHQITYDWSSQATSRGRGIKAMRETALAEVQGVVDANLVICLWPGGRGAHCELGVALGRNIRVVILVEDEGMKSDGEESCAFYHYPTVDFVDTYAELYGYVKGRAAIQATENAMSKRGLYREEDEE